MENREKTYSSPFLERNAPVPGLSVAEVVHHGALFGARVVDAVHYVDEKKGSGGVVGWLVG